MKPKKLKRVPLKEELVALTGDFVKALILQQFLYWSERVTDFDDFILEEKERSPGLEIELRNGWIYKSTEQLHDELMLGDNLSSRTVKRRLDEIVEFGYLISRNNPNHKWDRCLQYRPDIHKIQIGLQKLGYSLEGYPLFIPELPPLAFDTVSNASDTTANQMDAETNRSVADDQAIPETTLETTLESLKTSSANADGQFLLTDEDVEEIEKKIADFSRPISLLSEKEIKELKLPLSDWKQYLADEQAERQRKGIIDFLGKKIATGPLLPDTPAAHILFNKLAIEAEAKGRRPAEKFPTLALKKKFDIAATNLNGTLENAINKALEAGITSVPKIVNYISSPKWRDNDGQRTTQTRQRKPASQASGSQSQFAPPAGSGQSAETTRRLHKAFAPKSG